MTDTELSVLMTW